MSKYTITIDPDVIAADLTESWHNGNRKYVIYKLREDHPGLTALLLVQFGPMCDGLLTREDCNAIANLLVDERMERTRLLQKGKQP